MVIEHRGRTQDAAHLVIGPGFEIAYCQHFEERIGADQLFASGPTRHVSGGQ